MGGAGGTLGSSVIEICGPNAWNYICNNSTEWEYHWPVITDTDTCLQEQYCSNYGDFPDDNFGITNWYLEPENHFFGVSRKLCEGKCNANENCVGFNMKFWDGAEKGQPEQQCWLYTETSTEAKCSSLTVASSQHYNWAELIFKQFIWYHPTYGVKRSKIKEPCASAAVTP